MGRSKQYERQDVVNKALDVFWSKGFEASSLSDLTEATGLNKKTLYHEFQSKEGLFMAAIDAYSALRGEMASTLLQRDPLGLGNVLSFLDMVGSHADERGCLMTLTINESESAPAEAVEKARCNMREMADGFRANLQAACEAGDLRRNTPVADLANYLVVALQGLSTTARTNPGQATLDGIISVIKQSLLCFKP